jgi:hypothetical protein
MRTRRGKTTVLLAGAVAISLSVVAVACTSGSVKPSPAGGAGTTDAGAGVDAQTPIEGDQDSGLVFHPPDAADGAVVCPTPAFGGTTVDAQVVSGSPPAVLDDTCPGTDARQIPFTATATTVTLHSAMLRREVYTLRP